ncbi:hypothetical protein SLEP1_g31218 [Rubroshorea leprosula]|uniref:Uncharacterized protein n=1 Tax=Rubroshorea leprosula TaxID=152421 RepID=A0AAV5KB50_9ROSI|nr:hypothetical protein SLEP1_g31218 [Rubroshorea leprosula]
MFDTLKHRVDEFCGPEHNNSGSDDGHCTANAALASSLARPSAICRIWTSNGLVVVPETADATSHVLLAFCFMF